MKNKNCHPKKAVPANIAKAKMAAPCKSKKAAQTTARYRTRFALVLDAQTGLEFLYRRWGHLMTYELETARRYRDHAEELRAIAEGDRNNETREMLLKVALDYDRMARSMEAIDDTNRLMGKRTNPRGPCPYRRAPP